MTAMAVRIRTVTAADTPFLREALYQAVFVPPGGSPPPRTIIDLPDLAIYVDEFGLRAGDSGVLALAGETPVGAAWTRLIRGYGYINDNTPELSIALLPAYRGQGIGTRLLLAQFALLAPTVDKVSLSVQKANPAHRLYTRLGFEIAAEDETTWIMIGNLTAFTSDVPLDYVTAGVRVENKTA